MQSHHYPNIVGVNAGLIYDKLREMGFNYFSDETTNAVEAYIAHCLLADVEYSEDYGISRKPHIVNAEDPETGILWFRWGGLSSYGGAAKNTAFELAQKNGFDRFIIEPLS